MKNAFRKKHLFEILENYDSLHEPLDLYLRKTFRRLKQIGSKDRKEIADTIYTLIRWKGYIDFHCVKPITWEKRYLAYKKYFPIKNDSLSIPEHIKLSFPKYLYDLLKNSLQDHVHTFCEASNYPAPITLRVNPIKTTRKDLMERLCTFCEVFLCEHSPMGLNLSKKINLQGLDEYKNGHFEIQDEASQLISFLVEANPHDKVLDYCCGSGGKSLAFGHRMKNKGLLCLHDIRSSAISQAKKRLKRSGIQNVQFFHKEAKLKRFKGQMDWIILDVPCSGTGTLRRNPDMKWKYTKQMIKNLIQEQRLIFEKAVKYLKSNGKLVYATCSVLQEENEEQITYFTQKFGLQLVKEPLKTLPSKGGMDGFFGAVLKKK